MIYLCNIQGHSQQPMRIWTQEGKEKLETVCKLNFGKAYDRVNKSFLSKLLVHMEFFDKWVNW